jgi:FlaA1/EpsC-like NDP-sugar epimerase
LDILSLIGRSSPLFDKDLENVETELSKVVSTSSFLVLGGAGSIGQAVVKEIFCRNPLKLHVVDLNENNLAELVRDIRSSFGYIPGDFQTFALDIGSSIYDAFINSDGKFDFVLNLSALKHVRSEKDPFTLMRMIEVNILNTEKTIQQSIQKGTKKYFCVSTDKAANPVNLMGASKRIMEHFLLNRSTEIEISTARFANVAFSDGSLLSGFENRVRKNQPIVAPSDVKRYFITPQESGQLCLLSCVFGNNRDVFYPKMYEHDLISFSDLAIKYLENKGFEVALCADEDEARQKVKHPTNSNKYPCLFTVSDTTGEKEVEEFYTVNERVDLNRFQGIGIIKNNANQNQQELNYFIDQISKMRKENKWQKTELVSLFQELIPEMNYLDTGKYLDSKM